MEWLEKYELMDNFPKPIFVDEEGARRIGGLGDFKRTGVKTGYGIGRIPNFDLAELKPCSSDDYLNAIGMQPEFGKMHGSFTLEHKGRTIVIPALLLTSGFITDLGTVGDRILSAGSLNHVATPFATGESIVLKFGKGLRYAKERFFKESVSTRYEWLTCFPSARRMWSSVYRYAREGVVSLDPPKARVDISITGFSSKSVVYATKIRISKIFPQEAPLPMVAGLAKNSYLLNRAIEATSAQRIWESRVPRSVNQELQACISFPARATVWDITPEEWSAIRSNLEAAGFISNERALGSINLAIIKLVKGHTWKSIGPHWRAAEAVFRKWASNGKWKVLEATLQELRQTQP